MPFEIPDVAFGWWFAGLTDGEGSFLVNKNGLYYQARFQINLRADDRPLLEYIQKKLAMGKIYSAEASGWSKPTVMFRIVSLINARRLVRCFEVYPLLSKKRHDFEVWKRFVQFLQATRNVSYHKFPGKLQKMRAFQKELQKTRVYSTTLEAISDTDED